MIWDFDKFMVLSNIFMFAMAPYVFVELNDWKITRTSLIMSMYEDDIHTWQAGAGHVHISA